MEENRRSYKSPARGSNYRRDGPLSPLRSPLNRKFEGERRERSHRYSNTRKADRHESTRRVADNENTAHGTSWADITEQYEEMQEQAKHDLKTFQRRTQRYSESSHSQASSDDISDKIETDEDVIMRRQKQIDYGKCNESYEKYATNVPRVIRKSGVHPKTPNKFKKCSRRAWDGMVKHWKLDVHSFAAGVSDGTPQKAGSVSSANVTPSTEADRASPISDSPMTDTSDSPIGDSTLTEDRASRKQLMFGLGGPRPDILSDHNADDEW